MGVNLIVEFPPLFVWLLCLSLHFFHVEADVDSNHVKLGSVFPNSLILNQIYNLSISGYGFDPLEPVTLDFMFKYVSKVHTITPQSGYFKNSGTAVLEVVLFNYSGTVLLGNAASDNFLPLYVYAAPDISSLQPNTTNCNGNDLIQMTGTGLFYSNDIAVLLQYDNYSQTVPGSYDFITDRILFTTPVFEVPSYINREVLELDAEFLVSVSLALDGVHFIPISEVLVVQVLRTWKIGYIFDGMITTVGVSYDQNLARTTIDSKFQGAVLSQFKQNVTQSDAFDAALFFCNNDYDLIFGGWKGFISAMVNASYTDNCNLLSINNVTLNTSIKRTTYMIVNSPTPFSTPTLVSVYGSVWQLFYLSGLIAGLQLKKIFSNKVGFITDFNTSESRRYTNAFVSGCRQTNPNCRLVILRTGKTEETYVDEQAAQFLWFHEGCRIIAQSTLSVSPSIVFANGGPSAASIAMFQQANGLTDAQILNYTSQLSLTGYSFGYNTNAGQFLGNSVLTSIMIQWAPIIESLLYLLMRGHWPKTNLYKIGFSSGATYLAPFSFLVDVAARKLVDVETERLLSGNSNLFCGALVMEDGSPVPARQPNLTHLEGQNEYLFYNRYTGASCEQEEINGCECCLSDGIGMTGMWYQLEGTVPPMQCLDSVKCVFGTLVHQLNEAGFVEGWYQAPPQFPPLPPQVNVICNSIIASNTPVLSLELLETISEAGIPIHSYRIEWDSSNGFDSPGRDCTTGILCEVLVSPSFSPCRTPLDDGETSCLYTTIQGLESGITHFVRVFAFDGFRYSSSSTVESCMSMYTRTLEPVSKWFQALFGAIAGVGMLLGIVNAILLWLYKKHEVILSISCYLCILVSIGISMLYSSVVLYLVEANDTVCALFPWLVLVSYTLAFSPVFAKARRIHAYLSNTTFNRVVISDIQLLREVIGFVCLDCIGLALMTKYNPATKTKTDSPDSPYYYREECAVVGSKFKIFFFNLPSSLSLVSFIPIIVMLCKAAMFMYGAYFSFKVRNAPTNFNESRSVAFCMYNLTLTVIVLCPLEFLVSQPSVKNIIECMSLVWVSSSLIIGLFLPVWLRIFKPVRTFAENVEEGFERLPSVHGSSGHSPNLPSPAGSSGKSRGKYKILPFTRADISPTAVTRAETRGFAVNDNQSPSNALLQRPARAQSL